MKAIQTKYLSPTDLRGSRFVADDGDGNREIVPMRYDIASEENHALAVKVLCKRMKWAGRLQGADLLKAGRTIGMVWVWVSEPNENNQIEL